MRNKTLQFILLLLGILPFGYWVWRYFKSDLWYDEVYSLEHFALVDFSTTLFYYPAPNNHIFYNLITQTVSRIFSLRDILIAEEYSFVFRMVQIVFCILCAVYTHRILKYFFQIKNSGLVLVLLFTTIPFLNFSLQLRGYGLSMLLLLMLVYYAWHYVNSKSSKALTSTLLLSTVILYTIPSNLYVLGGLFGSLGLFGVFSVIDKDTIRRNAIFRIAGAMAVGVFFAIILYIPIWEELLYNKFSNRMAEGVFDSWVLMLKSLPQFLSSRYALLLLLLPGLYMFFIKSTVRERYYYCGLLTIFIGAFAISFVHQKSPYTRVFVPLAPIFVLLVGIPILTILQEWIQKKYQTLWQVLIAVYCVGTFYMEIDQNDSIVAENLIEHNGISQDLYRNYYLASFFRQDEVIQELSEVHQGEPILKFQLRDEPSANLYLQKYRLKADEVASALELSDRIREEKTVFVLTSHKKRVVSELRRLQQFNIEVFPNDESFTTIIRVSLE